MIRFSVPLAALAVVLLAPAAEAAKVLDTSLNASGAFARSCTTLLPGEARGVATKRLRAADTGALAVATRGAGDWDVSVFDASSGRFIAGSAQPGSRELAQGFVAAGQRLVLQACRFRGGSGPLAVVATTTPLKPSSSDFKVQVVAVHTPTRADKDRLGLLGLDPAEGATRTTVDVVLHDAEDAAKLRSAGFTWTVRIADLVALERKNAARTRAQARSGAAAAAALPSGRSDYRHLADYEAEMKALAAKHPGLVKLITLNHKSLEGRNVLGIEIAKNVNVDDGKPVHLQLGVHHAREWPAGEAPMEFAYDLINRYGTNDRINKIVDSSRTIVVPIVNPDGFNLSREAAAGQSIDPGTPLGEANSHIPPQINEQLPISDPIYIAALVADQTAGTYSYKRRNCRVADGKSPAAGECAKRENRTRGTDPNRNYGGLWGGPGASTSPTDDTYRGAGPFSEPETQNVRELVLGHQVTTLITNHTFTGLILRPPGVRSQGAPPDEAPLKALGDAMAAQVGYVSQPGYALYDTTGTTEDWSYGATSGYGYTYEIGKKQFHPPYSEFVTEYEGNGTLGGLRAAYLLAAESTVDRAQHGVLEGTAPPGTILRVRKTFKTLTSPVIGADGKVGAEQSFEDTIDDTITVGSSGKFEWHLNPSTRPAVSRGRVVSEPAATPATSTPYDSPTPVPPGQPRDISFDVPDGTRLVRAFIESEGPDYDIYLYENSVSSDNQVASGATGAASENLTYDYPKAGKYVLRIVNFAAVAPYSGAIELYQPQPGTERTIPAQKESYTLTCETPAGQVLTTNPLELDRGETETMNPCGQNLGPGKVVDVTGSGVQAGGAKFTFKLAVKQGKLRQRLRKGIKVRVQCSQSCRALAAATIPKRVATRFGLAQKADRRMIVARGAMRAIQTDVQQTTFTLKFSKKARMRLRRAKLIRFAVVGRATSIAGDTRRKTVRFKLRR